MFRVRRVHVNRQGYDAHGCYWGVGLPLFHAIGEDEWQEWHLRARDRAQAKERVLERFPKAKFYT